MNIHNLYSKLARTVLTIYAIVIIVFVALSLCGAKISIVNEQESAHAAPAEQYGVMRQLVDVEYIDPAGKTVGYRFTDLEQQTVCYYFQGQMHCEDRVNPVYPRPTGKKDK